LLKVIADWSKAKESGIFADNFFMDYFPDKLKIATAEAFAKAGKTVSVGDVVLKTSCGAILLLKERKPILK
jgi:hypothetical protein